MSESLLAAVKTAPNKMEMREFPMPDIEEDGGLLRVTACGVCGADVRQYPELLKHGPMIMGHEIVGEVARLGKQAAERWRLKQGDRIVIESYRICGHCDACISGYYGFCPTEMHDHDQGGPEGSDWLPDFQPSRGGGYSQYYYLRPNLRFHRLPEHVPDEQAALAIPIGNGWQWAYLTGGAGPGKTVLVEGPGQQGLGSVIAAKEAGAECIIVSGLAQDAARLEVARRLGADVTINVEQEDLRDRVMEITHGHGVDVALDVATGGPATVLPAAQVLAPWGTLVVIPGGGRIDAFPLRALQEKCASIKGTRGHCYEAVELSIKSIASGKYPLHEFASHQFALDEHGVDLAIRSTAGTGAPGTVHASVHPWASK